MLLKKDWKTGKDVIQCETDEEFQEFLLEAIKRRTRLAAEAKKVAARQLETGRKFAQMRLLARHIGTQH